MTTTALPFVPDPRIWFLTVMTRDSAGSIVRSRTWGYFLELEVAVRAVQENDADIYEDGYYNLALLEMVPWGTLSIPEAELWFQVDYDRPNGAYAVTPTDKPAALADVISFWNGGGPCFTTNS